MVPLVHNDSMGIDVQDTPCKEKAMSTRIEIQYCTH